jgi:hypothetical protein
MDRRGASPESRLSAPLAGVEHILLLFARKTTKASSAIPRILLIFLVCAIPASAQTNLHLKDRLRILRNVTVEPGETVSDVQCFACSVLVRGRVAGDVITVGGNIAVEGQVDGDAVAAGGGIEVRGQGKLVGGAIAVGGYEETKAGGVIAGKSLAIPYVIIPGQLNPTALGSLALAGFNVFFVGIAFAILRSHRVTNTANAIRYRSGLVMISAIVSLGVLYALNALCVYLGRAENAAEIVLGALLLAAASAGATGLGSAVARIAFPETKGIITVLAGILALTLLELVPLFGIVVFVAGGLVSLGAAVASGFGARGSLAPEDV